MSRRLTKLSDLPAPPTARQAVLSGAAPSLSAPESMYMYQTYLSALTPLQLSKFIVDNVTPGMLKKVLAEGHPVLGMVKPNHA